MIKRITLILLVFISFPAIAQIYGTATPAYDPVSWQAQLEKTSNTKFDFVFKADIEEDWHIYSQFTDEGGSLPLRLEFPQSPEKINLEGDAKESETRTEYSEIFGVEETFFADSAVITQRIQLKDTTLQIVKSILKYQVCKEVCINQEFYFAFDLNKGIGLVFEDYSEFEAYGGITGKTELQELPPAEKAQNKQEKKGLWTLFFVAFLSGFAALLTPCVFPMIPMTVSYFTKRSKDRITGKRNAILYGIFIIVIYVLLGTLVTALFGADALNALSTSVWFNVAFFILLVIFAISFFGAFEIMLPNSWANVVDKQSDRGGIVGIFFMALALAIVSFSCTGPIVGTLLVEAASRGGTAPIVGMLGFSSAIAIPFALFALFPGWMNSLPKSGGWLNSVKVVLGFLELALAFKFLSNADLVLQAHILEREIFLAIWIAIFGALSFYLFGAIRLSHDSEVQKISSGRLILGLMTLAFTIYMLPGLWGAPLKLISGFPPPLNYSESPYGVGNSKTSESITAQGDLPEEAELGPYQILTFTDYEAGIAYAKEKNKPILVDFTGKACVNCRKMEERVWGEPGVLELLKDEVVLISLFVDLQEELPESQQYVSETTGKRIKTVGSKWSDFQIRNYGINAQPFYVLLDHKENLLNEPVGYTPDADAFKSWLEEGITNFKN